jgi:hypothetical protein
MKYLLSALIITVITVTGCDLNNASSDMGSVQVAMKSSPLTTQVKTSSLTNTQNGTLEITEIKLFIDEMELESINDDSLDFEAEEFIVNLPLDGSPFIITEKEIPNGFYDEFELETERPDDDSNVNDSDFSDESGRYSVVVKGLWDGVDFTYRSSEDFELELEMNPPLEVTEENGFTLMVEVDINSWFQSDSGTTLNPNLSENREEIDESIENSFDVLEDLYEEDDDDDDDDDDNDD